MESQSKCNHVHHIRVLLLFALSWLSLHAAALPANSKVLIIGPAADIHATALEALIAGDSTTNVLNIAIDSFPTDDVLLSYFEGTPQNKDWYGLRPNQTDSNALLDALDQNYDVILIHPGERNIRVSPELHMEAVRLLERYVRAQANRIALLVPTHDPASVLNNLNPTDFTQLKERVYRIKDALELECIPVGICWEAVLQDGDIGATATSIAMPNAHAINVYAATIFAALFEAPSDQSTFRHGGISDSEFGLISAHAWQTWQTALTATHYSGDYVGVFSPFARVHDPVGTGSAWGGASTEGITLMQWREIYHRKGMGVQDGDSHVPYWQTQLNHDFYVARGGMTDSTISYVQSQFPERDMRFVEMHYKAAIKDMIARSLSTRGGQDDWYYRNKIVRPHKRTLPNYLAYARHWLEDNFPLPRYGDSHLSDNATMIQSALIYTILSGGDHPLSAAIDLDAWTGPQRYAAGLGYATVMGIGRLKKLEMAPVAKGKPRYHMITNTENPLELPGIDFNGLPVSVEIVTPPAHGNLVPAGDAFTYTPDADFSGLDSVTYRVSNGTDVSHPLTVMLPVEPYIPAPPQGSIIFEDNFDDQNIDDWTQSGEVFFVTAASSDNLTFDDGFHQPYDGTASVWLTGSGGAIERAIDTTGFESLQLTVRVGSGAKGSREAIADKARVEWFDGIAWHTLVSHGHTYATNRLLLTYDFPLPPEAAGNPSFALRFWGGGFGPGNYWSGGYVDSVRLSGDVTGSTRVVILVVSGADSDLSLNEANGIGAVVRDGDGQWTVTTPAPAGSVGTLLLELVSGGSG